MPRLSAAVLLLALFIVHLSALGKVTEKSKALPRNEEGTYVIPSPLVKITAFDFKGIASDFMFLKAITFIGSAAERKETAGVKQPEWKWIYNLLNTTTDIDPYFLDPYYLAQAYLTWDAGMVHETNALLEKGARYRHWDWLPSFFKGFNQFYFLQDNASASESLMTAWRRPGAPSFLASLASRLAETGKKTENAILFLEELLRHADDANARRLYEMRIGSLKGALYLEDAVARYKKRFGKMPAHLDDLVARGIVSGIPPDPEGGLYYLAPDGSIGSTRGKTVFRLQ